jgi:hypothetical protein
MNRVRRVIGITVGALVAGTLAGAAQETPKARFDKAAAAAKANLRTAPGQEYDRRLSLHFEQANGPVMQECFRTTSVL